MVSRPAFAPRQKGVTYFWVLLLLALISLGLGKLLEDVRMSTQREREHELLYVGGLYRRAIQQYWQSTPLDGRRYPERLNDLLRDPRYPVTRRYLRQLYPDPVTGKPLVPILSAEGGIMGVRSASSNTPVKVSGFGEESAAFAKSRSYDQWEFVYAP
ncbi:type II secretion system GspH family protein [Burkholderia sp. Ac-20365]|uniref:type II secretion system GspH family protein n=1 Tax=Burkholderia sp. Ac-20365 TaxID=2703897 RepID=UPI00197BF084|nr:type II secretion system GspH family protein [Burkholderia sp. Ac-20365]MBN3759417.1 type II secretion system protein [Burkholderia sp. Ac-20365]